MTQKLTVMHVCKVMRVPPWLVDSRYPRPRHPRLAWWLLRLRWWLS